MALRWKSYAPNTVLKAVEVQDLADNGCIQVDTIADLDDANLVNANLSYVVGEAKAYRRISAGVGRAHWEVLAGANAATGGIEADVPNFNGSGELWRTHTFTANGTLTVQSASQPFQVLVVGGGGGASDFSGGGAGGFIENLAETITVGTHPVTVGAGGAGRQFNPGAPGPSGGSSTFLTHIAEGGQHGGSGPRVYRGSAGASGAPTTHRGGTTEDTGVIGESGGGGGGAGGAGQDRHQGNNPSGLGGAGLQSSITGTAVWYAAGGNGGGGDGIAGNASSPAGQTIFGTAGAANTGSGGGGWDTNERKVAGAGAAGVVIVAYKL